MWPGGDSCPVRFTSAVVGGSASSSSEASEVPYRDNPRDGRGLVGFETFTDIALESWQGIIDVNLTGTSHCC
jgi:hypothetical protein